MKSCEHCHPERRREREPEEMTKLVSRLNRIEGQIKGIRAMLEDERYCTDILTQVAAAQQGLRSFGIELMKSHMKTCLVAEVQAGNEEALDEAIETMLKLCK